MEYTMEDTLIADDLIDKFIIKNSSKGDYSKSTQDAMSNEEITLRNLQIWAEYEYEASTDTEIAKKFNLSNTTINCILAKISKQVNF